MQTTLPQLDALPHHAPDFDLKEMFDLGVHYGHQKQKWHPKMSQFIHMEKDGVHIIDLAKTASQLTFAYNFLFQLGSEGKSVIFVGTKRQAREVVHTAAESAGTMYITTRWLGGLLTNWDQVKKSIKKMLDTEKKLAEDGYKGRTKYEVTQIEKDVVRAKRFFEGIQDLSSMPSALVVIDPSKEKIAVAEARTMGVPIIALIDTNSNPDRVDLPIPGNDDALKSVTYIVEKLTQGYAAGKLAKRQPATIATPATPTVQTSVATEQVAQVKPKVDAPAAQPKPTLVVAPVAPVAPTAPVVATVAKPAVTEKKVAQPVAKAKTESKPAATVVAQPVAQAKTKAKPAAKSAAKPAATKATKEKAATVKKASTKKKE